MNRKKFLKYVGGGSLALTFSPGFLLAEQFDFIEKSSSHKLTILHTNDQHSRIEPFDASYSKNPNQGGFARRASKPVKMNFRSLKLTFSPTHRPSHW